MKSKFYYFKSITLILFLFLNTAVAMYGNTSTGSVKKKAQDRKNDNTQWQTFPGKGQTEPVVFRLLSLPAADDPMPVVDANDTSMIETMGKEIHFISINGKRIFHLPSETWTFSISPGIYKEKSLAAKGYRFRLEKKELPSIPAWYKKLRGIRYYEELIRHHKTADSHFFLSSVFNEGFENLYDDLVDATNKLIFQVPSEGCYTIRHIPGSVWFGQDRGITRLNLKTLQLTGYTLLPSFEKRLQWCDYKGKRYITTDERFVQVLDIKTGAITILPLPATVYESCYTENIKEDNRSIEYYGFPERKLHLSNPIISNGLLYISIFRIGNSEEYAFGNNLLLRYRFETGTWEYYNLGPRQRVRRLMLLGERLWLISSWGSYYEGGEGDIYGKIAFMNKSGQFFFYKQLEKKYMTDWESWEYEIYGTEPIRAVYAEKDAVYFLCQYVIDKNSTKEGKGAIIKVSGNDYKTLEFMEPLFEYSKENRLIRTVRKPLRQLYQRFDPFEFETTTETRVRVKTWKIRYTMLETQKGKANILELNIPGT